MNHNIQRRGLLTTENMATQCALAICLFATTFSSGLADDWPQWRGANRDGKSTETGLLDKWPSTGPKLLWQIDGLGNGYSTPSAVEGTIYLLRNLDEANEDVVALSLADGAQRWTTRLGSVGKNTGPNYPGARSTPTIDGDALYALGSDGDLACLDLKSGSVRWTKNLRSDFGGKPGKWAYAESPLIDGDVLVCSPGGSQATVVALNKSDGALIWKAPLREGDDASFSSPITATINGVKQYVLFLAKGVVGLNAETGQPLWRYDHTADKDANVQTPVASGNFVYTAAGRVGGGLVKITGDMPQEVYFETSMPSGMGGSILVDGNLYGAAGQTLMCIDYATGKTKWQDRSIGTAALCYADGKLFMHAENNDVAMVAATGENYQELGRVTPPNAPDRGRSKAWTYPIVVDGKLLIRDLGSLWCYDVAAQ